MIRSLSFSYAISLQLPDRLFFARGRVGNWPALPGERFRPPFSFLKKRTGRGRSKRKTFLPGRGSIPPLNQAFCCFALQTWTIPAPCPARSAPLRATRAGNGSQRPKSLRHTLLHRRKFHIPRFAAGGKTPSFHCVSSPRGKRFAGFSRGPKERGGGAAHQTSFPVPPQCKTTGYVRRNGCPCGGYPFHRPAGAVGCLPRWVVLPR